MPCPTDSSPQPQDLRTPWHRSPSRSLDKTPPAKARTNARRYAQRNVFPAACRKRIQQMGFSDAGDALNMHHQPFIPTANDSRRSSSARRPASASAARRSSLSPRGMAIVYVFAGNVSG